MDVINSLAYFVGVAAVSARAEEEFPVMPPVDEEKKNGGNAYCVII
jgi:hypothetical protein